MFKELFFGRPGYPLMGLIALRNAMGEINLVPGGDMMSGYSFTPPAIGATSGGVQPTALRLTRSRAFATAGTFSTMTVMTPSASR